MVRNSICGFARISTVYFPRLLFQLTSSVDSRVRPMQSSKRRSCSRNRRDSRRSMPFATRCAKARRQLRDAIRSIRPQKNSASKSSSRLLATLRKEDGLRRIGTSEAVLIEAPGTGMSESYFKVEVPRDIPQGTLCELSLTALDSSCMMKACKKK